MKMKLSELLEGIDHEVVQGETEREISAVVYDSRKVTKGCLFICIEGANNDGHAYAVQAAMQGAAAVVVQKAVQYPQNMDTTFIKVDDSRYAMAFISAAWFGHPADKLRIIGVTGTKGKDDDDISHKIHTG
jgi:UDP-N-acetylmuramoyl-L-alanyl-D-glutamate--2,6-diaminopimelate ligase